MLVLAALLAAVPQRILTNDALQPHTYVSPSGEWSLFVDPSARDGSGESTVRIAKQGVVQWFGKKPFTFREAVIDDLGISAGHAYTAGEEGGDEEEGALVVAVLAPGGETLLTDATPRESRNEIHMPPTPCAKQILLHPDRRIAILRLEDPEQDTFQECWWIYQLSPAKRLDTVHGERVFEKPEDHNWTFALTPIRGTPLTLAQWCIWGDYRIPGAGPGSEFALYDEAWKLVWSLPLIGDLDVEDDGLEDQLFEQMRSGGGILDARLERRFELRHVAKAERVTYEVARDPESKAGWSVREVARAPFKPDAPKEPVELARLQLPAARGVALDVGVVKASGPVRDIETFNIDGAGLITFVRGEETSGAKTLVTIDPTGGVVRQVAVAPIEPQTDGARDWHALAGGDWLVTLKPWGDGDPPTRAWRIRGETGAAHELLEFRGPTIQEVEPTADGGFVLLGDQHLEHTIKAEVRRCAADGSTLWSHEEYGYGRCDALSDLCSAQDIAVDKQGAVLVLDPSRTLVQYFDPSGRFVKAIELEEAWDSGSSYLTDLILEPTGSILIHDIHDTDLWRRVSPEGKQLATIAAKRENGSTQGINSSTLRADAKGRLWGDDGHQLFELDGNGVVHERFGSSADPSRLTEVGRCFFDGVGRLALTDHRTYAVHLFTSDGSRAAVCIPDPTDFDDESSIDDVVTGPDGTIYVQPSDNYDRYLAFTSDGKRIGRTELGGTRVAFNRRTKERWAAGEGEDDILRLRCFGTDGKLAFETDRRPDGSFFENMRALACSSDGSVALFDGPGKMAEGCGVLCIYGPKGEPKKQIEVTSSNASPESGMRVGRRWIVMNVYESTALAVSIADGKCVLFDAPDQDGSQLLGTIGLSPDESELWMLQPEPAILLRFSLPK